MGSRILKITEAQIRAKYTLGLLWETADKEAKADLVSSLLSELRLGLSVLFLPSLFSFDFFSHPVSNQARGRIELV